MTPDAQVLIPTYKVVSRHADDCPHKNKGREYVQCSCRKHVSVYDPRIADPGKRRINLWPIRILLGDRLPGQLMLVSRRRLNRFVTH